MATMINIDGNLISVGKFYAAMYWGFVVSTSFVGISLVQGYLYFTNKNNKDRRSLKAVIFSLLVLDTATSLLMALTIFYYFIVDFGVATALEKVPISWTVENALTALVTTIVQVFFATRVYLVNNSIDTLPFGRTAPTLVLLFTFVAFVAGTVRTAFIGASAVPSFSQNLFQIFVIIEESSALMSDLLASACLCYMLTPPRIGSMIQSEIIKTLIMFTINRVILMSIVQIGLLVTYLAAKTLLYWMPFHLCKSKLYTNTLLAMLNSRSGGGFQSESASRPAPWSMPAINLTTKDNGGIVDNNVSTPAMETENEGPFSVGQESTLFEPTLLDPSWEYPEAPP